MQITVHRGTHQIGGCITEISTATTRIFIDMGKNLAGEGAQLTEHEEGDLVESLFTQNKKEHEAVFYTHSHTDHTGMLPYVPKEVEQYMSKGTQDLLLIKEEVLQEMFEEIRDSENADNPFPALAGLLRIAAIKHCKTWERPQPHHAPKSIMVGDIKVTPYFVSHSCYDCYMLLIEAEGESILHTGDYRAHGYLGKGLKPTLLHYIGQVDYLISEATMLRDTAPCKTEQSVSNRMYDVMESYKYVFVLTSSTDIERLAAINSATRRRDRVLAACSLGFYKALDYYKEHVEGDLFHFDCYHYSPSKPAMKLIRLMQRKGFTMLCSASHADRIKDIMEHFSASQTLLIYSAWDGYYKSEAQYKANPNYRDFRNMFSNVVDIHTSGHADCKTIQEVVKTVNPRKGIIFIHKDAQADSRLLELTTNLQAKVIDDEHPQEGITLH